MTTPNKAQHTPGPWRVAENYKSTVSVYGRSIDPFTDEPVKAHTYIAAVQEGHWLGEREANARLIAAAPELLEALRQFMPLATDAKCIQSLKWTSARDAARAAIAKTEGRAE